MKKLGYYWYEKMKMLAKSIKNKKLNNFSKLFLKCDSEFREWYKILKSKKLKLIWFELYRYNEN